MQVCIVGLGRMGGNIARRLMAAAHQCVVYDRDAKAVADVVKDGARGLKDLSEVAGALKPPRVAWVMLPAGAPTEQTVAALGKAFDKGDVVIDGGNSYYRDDIRRAKTLAERGVGYADVGTSGGVWGLERGYCIMAGGTKATFDLIEPLLKTLAPGRGDIERTKRPKDADPRAEEGYIHTGPVGSGHFVKMVHNGIEYGLMQAYAEGFDILKNRAGADVAEDERFDLNLADVAEVWRRGSVVSSWLLDLTASALASDAELEQFKGAVADSGEGRWTLEAAIETATPANVLAAALFTRFRSREEHSFAEQILSAMRFGFGGHIEVKS
ncbi:phosphogluconate dehydrogenase (NAD(+)-dependent, decarboxylating) [Phenylobacterium sp.]|jgi:6-phosphogluconate dehydrogenase|uniref:phosphogluconate dehydrogenase (NAD(+)-dependent, decarboxylating) n=1 Tax=Phenylobacterium sp. TaxID=1871053 RepID=UPI002F3F3759